MKAAEMMSTPVITVGPGTHLKQAARLMLEHDIGALPIVDDDGSLVGIVTEADLMTMPTPDPRSQITPIEPEAAPRLVEEVMTREVLALPPEADMVYVTHLMLEHRIKHVPIVEAGRLVGIVARRDILSVIVRDDAEIAADVDEVLARAAGVVGRSRAVVTDGIVSLKPEDGDADRTLTETLVRCIRGVVGVSWV